MHAKPTGEALIGTNFDLMNPPKEHNGTAAHHFDLQPELSQQKTIKLADIDNQPTQDLQHNDAIEKIRELAKAANICMFHTNLNQFPDNVTPMALQEVCDKGNLWFLSSSESNRNKDIQQDNRVALTFQNTSKYEFVALHGHASIHTDRETIEKYWTDFANAWFDGKDDPKVTVIKVAPAGGHYWDTKNGKIISAIKMVFSALKGAGTDDGGIEGELKLK